jgi:hypothetical protein
VYCGERSLSLLKVSCTGFPPAAGMVKISSFPFGPAG